MNIGIKDCMDLIYEQNAITKPKQSMLVSINRCEMKLVWHCFKSLSLHMDWRQTLVFSQPSEMAFTTPIFKWVSNTEQ